MKIRSFRLFFFAIIIYFFIIYPFETTNGFDGKREGIFIGLGIEPGVTIWSWTYDTNSYYSVTPSLNVPNFRIGYGLSEQFTLFLTHRMSFNGKYIYSSYGNNFEATDNFYIDGTSGLGFDYFPSRLSKFLLTGCLGLATSVNSYQESVEDILFGFGLSSGFGYELSRYLTLNFMLDYRRFIGTDVINIITLSLAFNLILY